MTLADALTLAALPDATRTTIARMVRGAYLDGFNDAHARAAQGTLANSIDEESADSWYEREVQPLLNVDVTRAVDLDCSEHVTDAPLAGARA